MAGHKSYYGKTSAFLRVVEGGTWGVLPFSEVLNLLQPTAA